MPVAEGFSEQEVITLLSQIFYSTDPRVVLGIGDDAAVVSASGQQVITTDVAVEGNHFRTDWSTAFEIGQRVARANVADVMAMNGRCNFLVIAVTLTGNEDLEWIEGLARGIQSVADEAGAVVVGGDLAKGATLTIAITAIGSVTRAITRSGAHVGDSIYLSSLTGWSAAGLQMLTSGKDLRSPAALKAVAEYKAPTLDYEVRFSEAHALCDISDAISIQGAQMAKASGARFEISLELLVSAPEFEELASLARECGVDVFEWIIQGGEDHVFLATGENLPGIRIGGVVEGSGFVTLQNGQEIKMAPVAWSHFN